MKSEKSVGCVPVSVTPRHTFLWHACFVAAIGLCLSLAVQARGQEKETVKCPYMEKRAACEKTSAAIPSLTEEQSGRIQAIRDEYGKETARIREILRAKKASLDEMFRDPKATAPQIFATQEELAALKVEKRKKTTNARLQARAVLSPEQIRALPPGYRMGIGGGGCPCGCGMTACPACPHAKKPCGKWRGQHP